MNEDVKFYIFPIDKTKLVFTSDGDKEEILCYTLAALAEKSSSDLNIVGANMGVKWSNFKNSCEEGKWLLEKFKDCKILFPFPRNYFWDFVDNKHKKNEYDYILFRAFQALKTIVGTKQYAHLTNEYLFARMCGCYNIEIFEKRNFVKGEPRKNLNGDDAIILKYFTRKRIDKLKRDLEDKYIGITFFAPTGCRGFYATTKEGITRETMAKLIEIDEGKKRAKQKARNEDNQKALEVWKQMKKER